MRQQLRDVGRIDIGPQRPGAGRPLAILIGQELFQHARSAFEAADLPCGQDAETVPFSHGSRLIHSTGERKRTLKPPQKAPQPQI